MFSRLITGLRINNWTTKTCILFCNIAVEKCKSDVARFTAYVQSCLATIQAVTGCEKLSQKVDVLFQENLYACAFDWPKENQSRPQSSSVQAICSK